MTKIIDKSFKLNVTFAVRWVTGLEISAQTAMFSFQKYGEKDIEDIQEIDVEKYRNLGTAVAGAVIGGILTGGIGLLAGAAFGGRKKSTGTYFIKLKDGNHVAFQATGSLAKHVSGLVQKQAMQQLALEKGGQASA